MATIACKKGHVKVNGATVKPSREVYATDKLEVRKEQVTRRLTVLDIPKSRVGAKLVDMYRVDTTPKENYEHLELLKHAKEHYRKQGTGRPTKKDRREIDEYLDDTFDGEETNA
ncbi:hypothetical protein KORDIASMS9_03113 [Kordia sp. SMS9]|nr:hypothetical protein KORDIASMS9_03113 [Kordia sp. SMS9]